MTIPKKEPPPTDLNDGEFPDLQDLLPLLLGQTDVAPNGDDVETYLAMMDKKFDGVPETDKRELIHFLLNLCETVIGIQFGVDPVQVALKNQKNTAPKGVDSVLNLQLEPQTTFKRAASEPQANRKKGIN